LSSIDPIALAFAGSADTDIDNIKGLLNDFVGLGEDDADGFPEPTEREVTLILPITKKHLSDGLEAVLEWSEYADIPFIAVTDGEKSRAVDSILKDAEEVVRTANVTAGIVDLLKNADTQGDAHVILLWGDEGSEEAELLLDAAEAAGIKAKDLTAGLDDISFASEPEAAPAPEPEPEPEPEAPKRGRRRGRRAEPEPVEVEEEPLTEDDEVKPEPKPEPQPEPEEPKRGRSRRKTQPEPEPEADPVEQDIAEQEKDEDLERQVNQAAQKAQRETKPVAEPEIDLLLIGSALEGAYKYLRLEDERNALANQSDEVRERPLTELLAKALHIVADKVHDEEAKKPEQSEEQESGDKPRRRGRPRDESKTFAFLVDDKGNYSRRGRGRIPAGQKVVHLTRAEIEEKGLDFDTE
jgi:hypothetical protein